MGTKQERLTIQVGTLRVRIKDADARRFEKLAQGEDREALMARILDAGAEWYRRFLEGACRDFGMTHPGMPNPETLPEARAVPFLQARFGAGLIFEQLKRAETNKLAAG
jgi:hypothetical protein